jgi:para-aminobenzoate synthetase component 1
MVKKCFASNLIMPIASFSYPIEELSTLEHRLLAWAAHQEQVALLNSNEHQNLPHAQHRLLFAWGAKAQLESDTPQDWLDFARQHRGQWQFGLLSYDLKNALEGLNSKNLDLQQKPLISWFVPQGVLRCDHHGQLEIEAEDPAQVWAEILTQPTALASPALPRVELQARFSRAEYLDTLSKIQQHIFDGDVYELNFCQEFFVENIKLSPPALYAQLNALAHPPFGGYYRQGKHHLLCASPERFLQKQGQILRSQPIKGTIKRGSSAEQDETLRQTLLHSEKDRAENVMIVDLVRNDLAKHCLPGSVEVEELFGIYTFAQVHQMISTIKGVLAPNEDGLEALLAAFPMGSMTGAPKRRSIELIEKYEKSQRGWYSGSLGYINPQGDFDFNVIIRSLLYEAERHCLSFQVGGAIVYDSVPEAEYEECLLKAKALRRVLGLS